MADLITPGISAAAWLWGKYGGDIADKAKDAVRGKWEKFGWKDAAEKYRAKIKKRYGTMQVMGMAEPVSLDDIFVEAYILDKPTAFNRYDITKLMELSADPEKAPEAKRIGGLSLVRENRNLFILGKPGAGKTTFLKYIALKAAEGLIDKVPVLISLKEWADAGAELLPFINTQFDICDFPEADAFIDKLLKSGNAIVLFDGLDEVSEQSGQREAQIQAMKNFVQKYDQTQCLITCRIAASEYTFQPFTYVEMADFTDEQVRRFVPNWFSKREKIGESFLTEFEKDENENLRELASSPLLLTLLCLSYAETLTFPQRRAEIYEEAMDALLKKWDTSRGIRRDEVYKKLSHGHKKQMFAQVAARTFEKGEYFLPQATLAKYLEEYLRNVPPHDETDGERVLKAIEAQHGIFTERAREIYSFSHLTFQEYFTARYIADNASRGMLDEMLEHCGEPRWREVFLLTTSLLTDAGEFLASFRKRIDGLIESDAVLVHAFEWAERKTNLTQTKTRQVREGYIWVLFSYVVRAPNLGFDLSLGLNVALVDAFDYEHEFDLRFVYASPLDLDPDLDLDRVLAYAYVNTHAHLESKQARTCALAKELRLTELEQEISALSIPTENSSQQIYKRFADNLLDIMVRHRGFEPPIDLTAQQAENLIDYFSANRLLKDCLELATVSPEKKEEILENLFLPPKPGC